MQAISGSHRVGEIKVPSEVFSSNSSVQFEITELDLENNGQLLHVVDFNAASGDVGLFHMNLIYRSGNNRSGKFRAIVGCRAHNSASTNFSSRKMKYVLS